jgi:subtilisin family serine protease
VLLLLTLIACSADAFYPDGSDEMVSIERSGDQLNIGSVPVWRTPEVAVKVADKDVVDDLIAWPGVLHVRPVNQSRGIWRLTVRADVDEIRVANELHDLPGVVFAHPNFRLDLRPSTVNDPLFADAWHLHNTGQHSDSIIGNDLGTVDAWSIATGEGQIIAIVDTGVDPTHPDLSVLDGYDFVDGDEDASPDPSYGGHGHGTAMAGIAAATGDNGLGTAGIAWQAKVLPVKLLGGRATVIDVYDAFVYAVDEGASVISNSWSYSAQGCGEVPLPGILVDAFDYAETEGRGGRGALVAMSLGNGGCDASEDRVHGYPTVVSVGAVTDLDKRVSYSNFGDTIDIVGYGGGDGRPALITTDVQGDLGYAKGSDYWDGGSGTSSACATISGVAALMFEANPRLTAAQAREAMCHTAVKPAWEDAVYNSEGWSSNYGCGRVDAWAAVQSVANGAPSVSIESPLQQVVGQVTLSWTGVDPDDDALTYRVVVWTDEPEQHLVDESVQRSTVVLSQRLPVGAYQWQVVPSDPWGVGQMSDVGTLHVVQAEEVGSCSGVALSSNGWWMLLIVVASRRRS